MHQGTMRLPTHGTYKVAKPGDTPGELIPEHGPIYPIEMKGRTMYYLFVDTELICKWCTEPIMQVVEDDPNKVVVKLCPVCDRWPDELLNKEK